MIIADIKGKNGIGLMRLEKASYKDMILVSWIGKIDKELAVEGINYSLKVIKKDNFKYLLVDDSNMKDGWPAVNHWLVEEIIPQLVDAGITALINIQSKNKSTASDAAEFYQTNIKGINMFSFKNKVEAINWFVDVYERELSKLKDA